MIENTYIKNSKSWSEFSSKINLLIENNKKLQAGKIYEKCVQLFLQTNPKYQAALKHVWLLQDVPKSVREKLKLPNADEGIDLIAETNQNILRNNDSIFCKKVDRILSFPNPISRTRETHDIVIHVY